ncbi:MAG: hypothetical protein VYC19_05850 [Pseudomonadota bacterium]|nr:hypothetical protein [Pseudomonadota bacterium]MEE3322538.1 hypothetical protein [Pseudomonadota bacterium]
MKMTEEWRAILGKAIWAASGDNAQPWSVNILSEDRVVVHLATEKQNVYNLVPIPDWISLGMFIENMSLATAGLGKRIDTEMIDDYQIQVDLVPENDLVINPISKFIESRSVNRLSYKRDQIAAQTKHKLAALFDEDMELHWFDTDKKRFQIARAIMRSTDLRLRMEETYQIHKNMLDWENAQSHDGLPIESIGLSAFSAKSLKWLLANERRNNRVMKLPGATIFTQIELDLIPAMLCGAHFIASFKPDMRPHPQAVDYVRAGRAMQRFWLTLTQEHLCMQPWYIVFMFSLYVERGMFFTTQHDRAQKLYKHFTQQITAPENISVNHMFFTGRVGVPNKNPKGRSLRKPLDSFIIDDGL